MFYTLHGRQVMFHNRRVRKTPKKTYPQNMFNKDIIEKISQHEVLNVAVHDGLFHADDVFSVALLQRLCTTCNTKLNIVRTRDNDKLRKADMRVDVGGIHNPETLDFDHHQRNDASLEQPEGIKHAAIGLLCQWCLSEDFLKIFREKYILGLEYQDNNGRSHEKYNSIGFFVQPFLPVYGQKENLDDLFWQAVQIADTILDRAIKTTEGILRCEQELPAETLEVLAGGKVLILNKFMPIQPYLHPEIAFTIVKAQKGYSFNGMNGNLIKKDFRGLNGKDIAKVTGYDGVFTHAGGFTGTMATLEGAKAICLASL